MRRYAPVLVVLLLIGCAKSLIVTGETLDFTAKQFAATGAAYNKLLDDKAITPAQYHEWATFAKRFQVAWPLAESAWQAASRSKDQKALAQASSLVNDLKTELVSFIGRLISKPQAGVKQGGTP